MGRGRGFLMFHPLSTSRSSSEQGRQDCAGSFGNASDCSFMGWPSLRDTNHGLPVIAIGTVEVFRKIRTAWTRTLGTVTYFEGHSMWMLQKNWTRDAAGREMSATRIDGETRFSPERISKTQQQNGQRKSTKELPNSNMTPFLIPQSLVFEILPRDGAISNIFVCEQRSHNHRASEAVRQDNLGHLGGVSLGGAWHGGRRTWDAVNDGVVSRSSQLEETRQPKSKPSSLLRVTRTIRRLLAIFFIAKHGVGRTMAKA